MNERMQIFTIFFAILWGFIGNVQPRWKAFQLPFIFKVSQELCRLLLSMVLLNLVPIIYFGWALWLLRGPVTPWESWSPWTIVGLVFYGVLPAFAALGFYRIWLGFIELRPYLFYIHDKDNKKYRPAGREEPVDLNPETGFQNLLGGVVYIVFSTIPLLVSWLR